MKISAAVIITAMICIPGMATVMGSTSYTLNVAGSTTVQPLMIELQHGFERFADVDMNVTGGGSGVGISSTLNGVADIGMLSRDLKPGEGQGVLVEHRIAKDAVVVIVNKDAGLGDDPGLTVRQLADIYSGAITNWSEVGGNDRTIAVTAREENSGTRDCFEAALKKEDPSFKTKDNVNSVNSTGAVLQIIGSTPGSIGYVNMNISLDSYPDIYPISVNGKKATPETVLDEDDPYAISRNLILVTNGESTGMVDFFINWILSDRGQAIVEESGFVRIDGR
jgi:phosphate transport system substrate-binding protein